MSSSGDQTKRRRVDNGDNGVTGEGDGGSPPMDLMSTLNQLLANSRTQTAAMTSMQQQMNCMNDKMQNMYEKMLGMQQQMNCMNDKMQQTDTKITSMREEMKHIKEEITDLRGKWLDKDEVTNQLKNHEILLKNQKWEYSAPISSELNGVERDFVSEMKNLTHDIRHGTLCDAKEINIDFSDEYIPFHEDFLPHWREFANALEQYQFALKCLPQYQSEANKLIVYGVELTPSVIALLAPALKSTHFKSLTFQENDFGQEGITFALNYMQNNPLLEELNLVNNNIENREDVERLCQIIKDHPSIHKLSIDDCCGAGNNGINGHDTLCSVMNAGARKLKYIDLSCNEISTGGSTFIADFLATNPILEEIILWRNRLNDDDAERIAHSLKYNTNLSFMNILANDLMTISGGNALKKAEYNNTDLNSISDSNHTCYIYEESRYNIEGIGENGLRAVRQKKIFHLLSARNREGTNIEHFDDISIELLPDMLRSIQQYSNYHVAESRNWPRRSVIHVSPLSIVFEILRRWDKSLSAFESLGYMNTKQSTCSKRN